MAVTFDHVNILTAKPEEARDFFVAVLGLHVGRRPPFKSPGYWLYQDESAIVHISDARDKEQTHVGSGRSATIAEGQSPVDHIAFRCTGYRETKARLRDLGITSHEAAVPGDGPHQVFVDGPHNVTLELIFATAEVRAAGAAAPAVFRSLVANDHDR